MTTAEVHSSTDQLVYDESELMREHDYASPHTIGGVRLHGGFMSDGRYQPPRALVRESALNAWHRALAARGGAPLNADSSLLEGTRLPTTAQQRVLLRNDLGETFWNGLTITGKIEARGRFLAQMAFPDLAPAIVEDISNMAIGHLNKGLLVAHGLDEGGDPDLGIGGHDAMWFVARDLAFGEDAFDDVDPPERIARPDGDVRLCPEIAPEIENMISFLANLLIIEFRAEIGFRDTQDVLLTDDLFVDRRDGATEAAQIVERIRSDEAIHVRSLCLYLGEMQSLTFRTIDGGTIAGGEVIDRFWPGLVRWATIDQPELSAPIQRGEIEGRIRAHPQADRILAEFTAAGQQPRVSG